MQIIKDTLPQFQHDFLVSWDFNEKDAPCICLSRLRKEGNNVVADVIGQTFATSGCISLRQVLEAFETREREEAERAKRMRENLAKTSEAIYSLAGSAAETMTKELEKIATRSRNIKECET